MWVCRRMIGLSKIIRSAISKPRPPCNGKCSNIHIPSSRILMGGAHKEDAQRGRS
jgi:hypothetical protein